MKSWEEGSGRAALNLTDVDAADRRRAPSTPQVARSQPRGPPLTAYDSADDLYASMAAARRNNLAELESSAASEPAAPARSRPGVSGPMRWIVLLSLAAYAAGSQLRRRRRRSE